MYKHYSDMDLVRLYTQLKQIFVKFNSFIKQQSTSRNLYALQSIGHTVNFLFLICPKTQQLCMHFCNENKIVSCFLAYPNFNFNLNLNEVFLYWQIVTVQFSVFCLSLFLSICMSFCLFACLFVCLFDYRSLYLLYNQFYIYVYLFNIITQIEYNIK